MPEVTFDATGHPATLQPKLPPHAELATRARAHTPLRGPGATPAMGLAPSSVRLKLHGHGSSSAVLSGSGHVGGAAVGHERASSSYVPEPVLEVSGASRSAWQREPSEFVPVVPCLGLSSEERKAFEDDGFVVLRSVVPEAECRRFLWQAVEPALRRNQILYDDEVSAALACSHLSLTLLSALIFCIH